ncbi:MAG: glycosyltransferase family A protein [Thermomicrobiales bacterium]
MPLSGPFPVAAAATLSLVGIPPLPECEATVIIPARDEADRIGTTLRALAEQRDLDGRPLDRWRYEVIVLANNCDDGTAGVVRRFAQAERMPTLHVSELLLPPDLANVGTARRLLMDEACQRLLGNHRPRGVIASLDADTRPAPTWLAATLREIARGADAVGRRIITDPGERATLPHGARLRHLRDVAFRMLLAEVEALLDPVAHDPWPRHFQHFGASMAVTAATYRRAGEAAAGAGARRCRLLLRAAPRGRADPPQRRCARRHLGTPGRALGDRLRAAICHLGGAARGRGTSTGRVGGADRGAAAWAAASVPSGIGTLRRCPNAERDREHRARSRRAAPLARRAPRSRAAVRRARRRPGAAAAGARGRGALDAGDHRRDARSAAAA